MSKKEKKEQVDALNIPQQDLEGKPAAANGRKRFVIFTITAFALLFAAIGGLLLAQTVQKNEALRQQLINDPTFRHGIEVNGVALGGLSMQEALEAVEKSNAEILSDIIFELKTDDGAYSVPAEAFGFVFDTDSVLREAFSLAREGGLRAVQEEIAYIQENGRKYRTTYQASSESVQAFVAQLAEQIDRAPEDAAFTVLIDKEALSEEEKMSEEYVQAAATRTPEECYTYTEHQDGIEVDQAALAEALLEMAGGRIYEDIEIPVNVTKAKKTIEDVRGTVTLRGSAYTSFAKSPYNRGTRVFNIKKAVGLINGTVILPGEEFSTNDTLGYRKYSTGWKPAPAIVQGRSEDQAGGGVCQVSSTLYNSVLKSDLEIVYRQGHSGRLSYVDGGLDATIDSGRIDFKWKNNTNSPVYVFAYVLEDKKEVHFEIFGEPFAQEFDEIKLTSRRVSGISPPGPMQYQVDNTKPVGYSNVYVARKSGSIWESYATYYKNGVEVKKVTLDRTTYRAYAGVTIVGPSGGSVAASSDVE